jgi:hypothetical protein
MATGFGLRFGPFCFRGDGIQSGEESGSRVARMPTSQNRDMGHPGSMPTSQGRGPWQAQGKDWGNPVRFSG